MTWEVPKLTPSKFDNGPIVSFDVVDESGEIINHRNPTIEEVFFYLKRENIIEAMNQRADFELWRNRKIVETIWPDYKPGFWRGKPNPYALR